MANTYISINLASAGGGSDDRKVKVSVDDSVPGFLEDKIEAGSSKVTVTSTNPGGDEKVSVDVDQTNINHDLLLNYDIAQHRTINDAGSATTDLWSADKIQTELDLKKIKEIVLTADPSAANDAYDVGTLWVNTTTEESFICIDNTASNAVWKRLQIPCGTSRNVNTGECFDTIQDGIDALNDYETLLVISGDHSGQNLDFSGSGLSNVTVMGFGSSGTRNTVVGRLDLDNSCNNIEFHNVDFRASAQDTIVDTGSIGTSFNECNISRNGGSVSVRISGTSASSPRFSNCIITEDISLNGTNLSGFITVVECTIDDIISVSAQGCIMDRSTIISSYQMNGTGSFSEIRNSEISYIKSEQSNLGFGNFVLSNVQVRDGATGLPGLIEQNGTAQYRFNNVIFDNDGSTLNGTDISDAAPSSVAWTFLGKTKAALNSLARVAGQVHYATDEGAGYIDDGTSLNEIGYASDLSDHISDATDAHAASAITNTPAGNVAATTVQAAIDELDTEKYVAADFDGDFDTRLGTKSTTDLSEGTNLYYTDTRAKAAVGFIDGDIVETSFAIANSASGANITGLNFVNATTRSFKAKVSVEIDATADLYETFTIEGIQLGSDWEITVEAVGDDSLIDFDISTLGQLIYDSGTYAGFVSGTMKFRTITTSN